jgi:hypothetical protein
VTHRVTSAEHAYFNSTNIATSYVSYVDRISKTDESTADVLQRATLNFWTDFVTKEDALATSLRQKAFNRTSKRPMLLLLAYYEDCRKRISAEFSQGVAKCPSAANAHQSDSARQLSPSARSDWTEMDTHDDQANFETDESDEVAGTKLPTEPSFPPEQFQLSMEQVVTVVNYATTIHLDWVKNLPPREQFGTMMRERESTFAVLMYVTERHQIFSKYVSDLLTCRADNVNVTADKMDCAQTKLSMYAMQRNSVEHYCTLFKARYQQLYVLREERRQRRNDLTKRELLTQELLAGTSLEANSTASCHQALSLAGEERLATIAAQIEDDDFIRSHVGAWIRSQAMRSNEPTNVSLRTESSIVENEVRPNPYNDMQTGDDAISSISQPVATAKATNETLLVQADVNVDAELPTGERVKLPPAADVTAESQFGPDRARVPKDAASPTPVSPVNETVREYQLDVEAQTHCPHVAAITLVDNSQSEPPAKVTFGPRVIQSLNAAPTKCLRPIGTSTLQQDVRLVNQLESFKLEVPAEQTRREREMRAERERLEKCWANKQLEWEQKLRRMEERDRDRDRECERLRGVANIAENEASRLQREYDSMRDMFIENEKEKQQANDENAELLSRIAVAEEEKRAAATKLVRFGDATEKQVAKPADKSNNTESDRNAKTALLREINDYFRSAPSHPLSHLFGSEQFVVVPYTQTQARQTHNFARVFRLPHMAL